MAVTQFTKDMNIIAALSDEPNDSDGLSAAQLKAKFDEGGLALKEYLNDSLIPDLTAANVTYTDTTGGGITGNTVSEALESVYTQIVNTALGTIPDGSITEAKLDTDSVTTVKILDGAVTSDKIDSDDWASKADLDSNSKLDAGQASARIVTVSASKTLALTDAGTFQYCTNSSAASITIPLNASVAFASGTEIEIFRAGAGSVTVAATVGVTILCMEAVYAVRNQYTSVSLKKVATDTWILQGNVGTSL
jgi:hypothetical protein